MKWTPDFPEKFCENQLREDGKVWCGQKVSEGYNCICPYQRSDLTDVDGEVRPQKNPQPNADGVCRDYEAMEVRKP